jgi:hypothetical protein
MLGQTPQYTILRVAYGVLPRLHHRRPIFFPYAALVWQIRHVKQHEDPNRSFPVRLCEELAAIGRATFRLYRFCGLRILREQPTIRKSIAEQFWGKLRRYARQMRAEAALPQNVSRERKNIDKNYTGGNCYAATFHKPPSRTKDAVPLR